MNYVIYDLEFNQKTNKSEEIDESTNLNVCEMNFEIIQIGAVKLNENFETISTFSSLIKPTLYKEIHPFVEKLTKITTEMTDAAENFTAVHEKFLKFIGEEETVLCIWGTADIKELIKNLKFHNISYSYIDKYIDIQKYASKYLNAPPKSRIGLRNSIELLSLPIEGEFHDAFNDAYYTAEIFKIIHNDSVKPKIYTGTTHKRISKPKEKINIAALIGQFEKMYNREMSEEEKTIIKLAYMMGKTNQFIL